MPDRFLSGHSDVTDWKAMHDSVLADCLANQEERDRLRVALDALTHAAREFSTKMAYEGPVSYEEEFVAALEDAEAALR